MLESGGLGNTVSREKKLESEKERAEMLNRRGRRQKQRHLLYTSSY